MRDTTGAEGREMTFLEHLEELRWTVVRSAIAVAVFMVAAFVFKDVIFDRVILAPKEPDFVTYRAMCLLGRWIGAGEGLCMTGLALDLQNITISGQFTTHLLVSLVAGIILAFPYVLWEIWRFVAPGLRPEERGGARGLIGFATALFLVGVSFGYFVLAPLGIQFFGTYQVSSSVRNAVALDSYIGLVTSVSLWTGLVFEMPLVVLVLTRMGLLGPALLRLYRRHAFVGVLLVGAILTPPDVISQLVVAGPLMLLYEFSILLSARVARRMEAARVANSPRPA